MANDNALRRYRKGYACLLRFHSKSHQQRFAEGMEQTFHDLLRDQVSAGRSVLLCAIWMYAETSLQIVRTNMTTIIMNNKRLGAMLLAISALLLVPFFAMKFTTEVNWTASDFILAGVMLYGTALLFECVMRFGRTGTYRAAAGLALVTCLMIVWANGAVGIIGSEDNPINLLFFIVLAIGFLGTIIARLRPIPMSRVVFTMALVHALLTFIGILLWQPELDTVEGAVGVLRTCVASGMFAVLFVGSALLFRQAGAQDLYSDRAA